MTTTTTPTPDEVLAELAELKDPRIRKVNQRNGDDHGVNLTALRAVASAGWALTSDRVVRDPGGLDLPALLDVIEAEMADAHERLQWQMSTCLAQIGITQPIGRKAENGPDHRHG